ncbi:MAG: RES family NAD+ phosphorylase [Trueperaceae bacterium]
MRLWRLFDHQTPWAKASGFDSLDGSGGLFTASRWNQQGTRMVYLASSASLCVLETLAHVNPTEFGERKLLELEVPATSIATVSEALFIQLLRDAPKGHLEGGTREYGSRWAKEGRSLLLSVPSIIVPVERNYLLNPLHPNHQDIRIVQEDLIRLDMRIIG